MHIVAIPKVCLVVWFERKDSETSIVNVITYLFVKLRDKYTYAETWIISSDIKEQKNIW